MFLPLDLFLQEATFLQKLLSRVLVIPKVRHGSLVFDSF
jgi:hypothetical protein